MFGYIYKITNLINGKVYIGKHKYDKLELDENYIASGVLINKAINKYGIENFGREIIDSSDTPDGLNELEKFYISKLNSMSPNGYNLTEGGDGISNPTPEIIEKNRMKHLGKKQSEETKKRRNEKLKNVIHTYEWCENISKANKGQVISDATKKASSVRHASTKWYNDGEKSYMLFEDDERTKELNVGRLKFKHVSGFKRTEETKEKLSKINKGSSWYNDGVISKLFKPEDIIPEGFVKGRLKFR